MIGAVDGFRFFAPWLQASNKIHEKLGENVKLRIRIHSYSVAKEDNNTSTSVFRPRTNLQLLT